MTRLIAMLDYETTGTNLDCSLVAAGLCIADFDMPSFRPVVSYYSKILFDRLHNPLKFDDVATLIWWFDQSKEAQQAFNQDYAKHLGTVLREMNDILVANQPVEFLSKGADFDLAMTIARMAQYDMRPAWKYSVQRCYRTREADWNIAKAPVAHHALQDATNQLELMYNSYRVRQLEAMG